MALCSRSHEKGKRLVGPPNAMRWQSTCLLSKSYPKFPTPNLSCRRATCLRLFTSRVPTTSLPPKLKYLIKYKPYPLLFISPHSNPPTVRSSNPKQNRRARLNVITPSEIDLSKPYVLIHKFSLYENLTS